MKKILVGGKFTVASGYYSPVKYFLTSYRALSDGRSGIQHLEQYLNSSPDFWDLRIGAVGYYRWGVHVDIRSRRTGRLVAWSAVGPGTGVRI